ncbi:unnamed protein product [Rhizoctonia solani]|uniref:Uncharacterized protein n=1 Tax=Rhizoctonia solani TaxID=456999 RepID=A0A8H3EBJ6_9AGAM|nr:unnamed protein product [Rhizoctonia solani]
MGSKSATGKQPRRLVVDFGNCLYDLIQNDSGDHPQLVHREGLIETSSRLIRFATLLGLAKGDKSLLEAVERAHIFITSNYLPGDQVILAVWTYFDHDTDCYAKATQILARHLVRHPPSSIGPS